MYLDVIDAAFENDPCTRDEEHTKEGEHACADWDGEELRPANDRLAQSFTEINEWSEPNNFCEHR